MKNSWCFLFCLIVMILAANFTNAYPLSNYEVTFRTTYQTMKHIQLTFHPKFKYEDKDAIKSYNTDNYHNMNKRVIVPISKLVKIYRGIQEILDALQTKTRHWLKLSEAINYNAFFTRSNLRTR